MRIQISNRQLQLLQEALKDDIPQYMQDIVKQRHGEKYLDMDVPEHTQLIPEITVEITDEDLLHGHLYEIISEEFDKKLEKQWKETLLFQLLTRKIVLADNFHLHVYNLIYYSWAEGLKNASDGTKASAIISSGSDFVRKKDIFYGNNFLLLQSKDNDLEYPKFSQNKSNLYKFLISVKKAFPQFTHLDPNKIWNDKHFQGLRNPIINYENIKEKIKINKVYLHITSKPYDILRMSVSEFYDSCQNIYTGGVMGTKENKHLLSNVFDKNSKVAFLIYDAPFTDSQGNKHQNSPVARMIIRKTNQGAILFDEVYPSSMWETMHKIVTDMTGLQNTGSPGDLYHHTAVEGLPQPYMDNYETRSDLKLNMLANYLGIDISEIIEYELAPSLFIANSRHYKVFSDSEIDEQICLELRHNPFTHLQNYTLKQVFYDYRIIPLEYFKRVFMSEFEMMADERGSRVIDDKTFFEYFIEKYGILTMKELNTYAQRRRDINYKLYRSKMDQEYSLGQPSFHSINLNVRFFEVDHGNNRINCNNFIMSKKYKNKKEAIADILLQDHGKLGTISQIKNGIDIYWIVTVG